MFKSFRVDYYSGNRRFPEPLLLVELLRALTPKYWFLEREGFGEP